MMNLTRRSTLFLLLTTASAFTGPSNPLFSKYAKPSSSTSLPMAKNNGGILQTTIRAFGVAATVLAFNTANVPAFAEELVTNPQGCEVIYSSSIQISETIKTMDFSMPSNYNAISDAKASAVDELSNEENVITGTKVKKAPKKTKSSSDEGLSFGGPSLTAEEKAQLAAQKRAEREEAATEKAALAAEKQSEREALATEKQAEKEVQAAERATEKAKNDAERGENQKAAKEAKETKEAAKAAKAEQREKENVMKGADFLDMALPSYGDSAKGKEKSLFSI